MNALIESFYLDVKIQRLEHWKKRSVTDIIYDISKQTGIKVYFFDYQSELNNLGGEWRIFLNQKQNKAKIWQDFGRQFGVYISYQLLIKGNRTDEMKDFFYHFCVPTFLLNELMVMPSFKNKEKEKEWLIGEIARVFHVEYQFAKTRLGLYLQSF
ncbi:hypothetical protein C0971_00885 [Bacillus methanolicus]|uniref:hypothetical protein n=1 Tax=Bacillus methanolicus TaxID=1471 RepID=UPI0020100146|nr:hypothetical protein [Bacillus methanolicus]UQD50774.1 hypothetical protein C0971_00885 [Bacillus methanolicus]